jgi:hypothetical protein
MFIVLINRLGASHILLYKENKDNWHTLCNKIIQYNITDIKLAADNSYPGLCYSCKTAHDSEYKDKLDHDLRMLYNSYQSDLPYILEDIYNNTFGNHTYSLQTRKWRKLNKYKKLIK